MPKTCCSCRDAGEGYYEQSGDTCMCASQYPRLSHSPVRHDATPAPKYKLLRTNKQTNKQTNKPGGLYLNGWKPIVAVQLLAMCGMIFSVATLADCSFAELDKRMFFPEDMDENLPLKVTQTQYVGFLTWKGLNGSCYWYNYGSNWEDQLTTFHEMLGKDWEKAFLVAAISASLSFVFFCYLLTFTCSSQVRGVRYFNTIVLCLVLTTLQSTTFGAFSSSLCDEYGCTFSRSAAFSVTATACFFLSGLFFFGTTDYRGPSWNKEQPRLVPMKKVQVAPDHPKDLSVPFSDSMQFSEVMQRDGDDYNYNYNSSDGIPEIEEVMPDYEEEIIEEEIIEEEDDDANVDGRNEEYVPVEENDEEQAPVEENDEEQAPAEEKDEEQPPVEEKDEAQPPVEEKDEEQPPVEEKDEEQVQAKGLEPEEEQKETERIEGKDEEEDNEEADKMENSDVALDATGVLRVNNENNEHVDEIEVQIASDGNGTTENAESENNAVAAQPASPANDEDDAITAYTDYTEITVDDSKR
eukprot:jgi/Psemu1/284590/fgenesh1_pg.58_\